MVLKENLAMTVSLARYISTVMNGNLIASGAEII